MNLISVIVTTYNWPDALKLCLNSLFDQHDPAFEIIIADDGSSSANQLQIRDYCTKSSVSVQYVNHEDQGFRAGTIRNKAVAISRGDYLIFIDGDCVCRDGFIASHRKLAKPGCFVPGNRVLLNEAFTNDVIENQIALHQKPLNYLFFIRLQNKINRLTAFITLPLGFLRKLQPKKWQKAMTCNLAIWKNDFLKVNGFDEVFEGWGYEDSDLVIRLIHAGIKRKEGRFAVPVLHLWHTHNDKSKQDINYQRLLDRLENQDLIVAEQGVAQYLEASPMG
ncbi:MAG: glycosyltransferase family 2 protein [Methylobacter sp.]|nr:glycosyltransferase family 2 protein [Methylobacter sp.]